MISLTHTLTNVSLPYIYTTKSNPYGTLPDGTIPDPEAVPIPDPVSGCGSGSGSSSESGSGIRSRIQDPDSEPLLNTGSGFRTAPGYRIRIHNRSRIQDPDSDPLPDTGSGFCIFTSHIINWQKIF